jgi:hypothetical protein
MEIPVGVFVGLEPEGGADGRVFLELFEELLPCLNLVRHQCSLSMLTPRQLGP